MRESPSPVNNYNADIYNRDEGVKAFFEKSLYREGG